MNINVNVKIVHDDSPESPRDWDHYGIMACSHRRYNLGDAQIKPSDDYSSWDEVEKHLILKHGAVVILPLYLYDHSGISISTRSFIGRAHHADWDSGRVGFIYATRDSIKRMQGWKKLTKERLEKVKGYLEGEVKEYDQFLTGDVYGYIIEINGEQVDSCWGFYGMEYARNEAISVAQHCLAKQLIADLEVTYV